jgi:hypothetical protein
MLGGQFDLLLKLSVFSPLLPVVLLPFKIKRASKLVLGALFLLLIWNFFTDLVSLYMANHGNSNQQIYVGYCAGLSISLFWVYWLEIQEREIKKIMIGVLFSFLTFIGIIVFRFDGLSEYRPEIYIVLSILVLLGSMMYFVKIYRDLEILNLYGYYFYWLNSGILVYFGSTIILTFFEMSVLSQDIYYHKYLWPIQLISTVMFNLFIARSIWTIK